MSIHKNWQTKRPSIRERTKFMLNNHLFSDVKFVAYKSSCDNESKEVISAHKFVLSIGSPVFEAMFYGELAETSDSIELPDCEFESLLEFFRFLYSDEVNLSRSNVMGVLYLAKKYMVPTLAGNCTEYLKNNVEPSNVFNILSMAEKYGEKNLVSQCWEVVDGHTQVALKADGFATIEKSLLEAVVIRDTLNVKEVDLFRAVNSWATKKCQTQGLPVDGKVKRKILGERIVKSIRFPVMKQEEFAAVVLDSKILTTEEIITFFKFFSSALTSSVGFPQIIRPGVIHRCERFRSLRLDKWLFGSGYTDPLSLLLS